MRGQRPDIRIPAWVDRPVQFETAADPIQELFLSLFFGRFHGVMEANQSYSFVHEAADRLQTVSLKERVPAAAVAVENHRGGAGECLLRIGRPAVQVDS